MNPWVEAVTEWRVCPTPETIGNVLDALADYLAESGAPVAPIPSQPTD